MEFTRTLKSTEYRGPNYFINELGEQVEGDVLTVQLVSQDIKCFGQMSTFVADFASPLVSELVEEMYRTVEISIQKNPKLYCECRQGKNEEKELMNEFRSQNII